VLLTLNPVTVKVKLSLYRPRYALKAPEVWSFQDFWQSANEGGNVVSPGHRILLPPRQTWYFSIF
jgi:hypothetical protein